MIKLDVGDYCHTCDRFEADVEHPDYYYDLNGNIVWEDDTIIYCKHRRLCKHLVEHLKEKLCNT